MSTTTKPARWTGITLILIVGLLGLHLPHYLAETASPAGYAGYPGLVLAAMMLASVIAAVALGRDRQVGWVVGTWVAVVSWVLYLVQETGGLPGLSQTWWEPTRLFSLLLAAAFIALARQQRKHRHDGATPSA